MTLSDVVLPYGVGTIDMCILSLLESLVTTPIGAVMAVIIESHVWKCVSHYHKIILKQKSLYV